MCVINWIGSSDDWALAIHRKNEKELLKYKIYVWFYTSFSYTEVCKNLLIYDKHKINVSGTLTVT